jgi:hypothetical protein
MTKDRGGKVTISVYHVVNRAGGHRFITTNNRFVEYLGGSEALELRLRDQFRSFELIGNCSVFDYDNSSQTNIEHKASLEIVSRIKEIAREHPGTDPLPRPWSEAEYQKDMAVASGEPQAFQLMETEIVNDLLQVQAAAQNIYVVIAIIHHRGKLLAGPVLQDALLSSFALHDGGVPVDKGYISILPDPASSTQHWKSIPPEKLAIPLSPPPGDQPVAYLVLCAGGQHALALAGRRDGGRVCWSGNADLIDMITHLLADVGILNRSHISTIVKP